MIRVVLVEDTRLMRGGLATLLSREDDIAVVGDLDFESDVAPLAAELWPRVVVINTDYMVSQVLPIVGRTDGAHPPAPC